MNVKTINDIFKLKPHDVSKAKGNLHKRWSPPCTNVLLCGLGLYKKLKKDLEIK